MNDSAGGQVVDAMDRFRRSGSDKDLRGGDGNSTSGGMEERVARLEKNVDQLAKDVGDIRVDLATLKENVRHLPTKPWIFTALAGLLASLSVIMGMLIRFLPHA